MLFIHTVLSWLILSGISFPFMPSQKFRVRQEAVPTCTPFSPFKHSVVLPYVCTHVRLQQHTTELQAACYNELSNFVE